MDWSILLGAAVIGYAVWILVRHVRRMRRGDCSCCSFQSGCDGHCKDREKIKQKAFLR